MTRDVLIVGGGVAGLSAGIFTARAGLDTLIVDPAGGPDDASDADGSILERNAHLENYPGFPAGIDARLYLKMVREQAAEAGCSFFEGRVADVRDRDDGFAVELDAGEMLQSTRVIAASWSDVSYLDGLDIEFVDRGSKTYVGVDEHGRTNVSGLYAAGRVAGRPHQAIVAAGHGATVGLTAISESNANFYHDWVTPEGYFTGRERDVPPGCEEIDDIERGAREAAARDRLSEWIEDPLDDEPTMHPSVDDSA
ncbi:FAD binding domain-containing protein [Natronoarchaeum philippinense]|uniref:FAD binding domain-containing protein n=1 Tax=Natronoarchaeum philippinense TaxID=558529 RepID=A0A285N3M0_NATPI|nr:NAD(P)/FAD-dependent oxidoreductase [Natronoarchaeum philippinense]SNZ02586.1 FAD binding domain-containing protein [Natronoarchaeum philippinense]